MWLDKVAYWNSWLMIMLQYPIWWVLFKIDRWAMTHFFRGLYNNYEVEMEAREWWENYLPIVNSTLFDETKLIKKDGG